MGILSDIEPKEVLRYFEEIAAIPHGSTDTKKISNHIAAFAKELGLKYHQDEYNNLIIEKPASKGYENHETVILQGHMDMVCEKEDGYDIDFTTDGLRLRLDGDILTADGTTLGGDDGIAVAYCMAILADNTLQHPPLEVVLTVDEEIGMLGAAALDMSGLKGRKLLNIDSEDEGILLVSCAGGVTATVHLPIEHETVKADGRAVCRLTVSGLKGGHSGVEIDKGRANSNVLLGRALYAVQKAVDCRLSSVRGGLKDNAIPRKSEAVIIIDDIEKAAKILEELSQTVRNEYRVTDPDIEITLERIDVEELRGMNKADSRRVTAALMNLPCGIQSMSFDIEGLVESSLNLGILDTLDEEVTFSYSVRSCVGSRKDEILGRMESLAGLIGGTLSLSGDYPAWEYKADSKLRDIMIDVFEEQYGRKPIVQSIHAGVECGLFAGNLEGLDAISFGPDMKDIHTPKESMDINSVRRTWKYLLEVLSKL